MSDYIRDKLGGNAGGRLKKKKDKWLVFDNWKAESHLVPQAFLLIKIMLHILLVYFQAKDFAVDLLLNTMYMKWNARTTFIFTSARHSHC